MLRQLLCERKAHQHKGGKGEEERKEKREEGGGRGGTKRCVWDPLRAKPFVSIPHAKRCGISTLTAFVRRERERRDRRRDARDHLTLSPRRRREISTCTLTLQNVCSTTAYQPHAFAPTCRQLQSTMDIVYGLHLTVFSPGLADETAANNSEPGGLAAITWKTRRNVATPPTLATFDQSYRPIAPTLSGPHLGHAGMLFDVFHL